MSLLDGLLAWYDLAENAEDQHAGQDATNVGGVTFADGAAHFTGTQRLDTPITALPAGDFSFALWVQYDATAPDNYNGIVHKGIGTAEQELHLFFTAAPTNVQLGLFHDPEATAGGANLVVIPAYAWVLLYGQYVAETIWLSGSVGESSPPEPAAFGPRIIGSQPLVFGHYPGFPLHGALKRVAFWNRGLSVEERTALFNDGAGLVYADLLPPRGKVLPTVEVESAPDVWTDLSADVIVEPIRWSRGITGAGPLDRIAAPGSLAFSLDNTAGNSHGLADYYTPTHVNAPAWFKHGLRVRLHLTNGPVRRYVWRGRLHSIAPEAEVYGLRLTHCLAEDWMTVFALTDAIDLPLRANVTADVLVADLIAEVAAVDQPAHADLDVGTDLLAVAFDDLGQRQPKATEVAQDIMQTELGFLYLRGDDDAGETLRFENRTARVAGAAVHTFAVTDLPYDPAVIDTPSTLDHVVNAVEVMTVPRRLGTAGQVLIQLDQPLTIARGETRVLYFEYRDPANESESVGALNMLQPSAPGDFTAWEDEAGTIGDLSSQIDMVGLFYGSRAELHITNNAGATAYIRGPSGQPGMQARGTGVYAYRPVNLRAVNQPSIDAIGARSLGSPMLMAYQSDEVTGQAVAQFLADVYGGLTRQALAFRIANDDATLEAQCLLRDVGDVINVPLDEGYARVVIHGLAGELDVENRLTVHYTLAPSLTTDLARVP